MKVNGRWAYLYRAVDSRGRTVDFYLSSRRNSKAAYRFLGKILNNVKKWQIPRFINTDKAPAYGRALALLKREGRCPSDVEHRQIKYRNNVIECDHGKLKRIIGATLGFKSMKTAYATIKGIEVMRALRKGQASAFYYGDPLGEMRLVSILVSSYHKILTPPHRVVVQPGNGEKPVSPLPAFLKHPLRKYCEKNEPYAPQMLSVRAYQPVFVCTSSGRVCRQHRDGVFAGRNGSAAGPEDY